MAATRIARGKYIGLSTDTKPARSADVPVGSTFYAYDIGALYITHDGTNWVQKSIVSGPIYFVETAVGLASNNATVTVPVNGRYLLEVATIPGTGTEEPTAYTGAIADAWGREILAITTRSVTLTETINVPDVIDKYPPMLTDWTITLTGIGDANEVTVYLVFA